MPGPTASAPLWSTASFGDEAHSSPQELRMLASHLKARAASGERFFAMRCVADSMRSFVVPRLVTTMVIVALLIGLGLSML